MNKKVAAALVGCGNQAHENLLPNLHVIPEMKLVAVCDAEAGKAKETGLQYGCRFYTDTTELFESEQLNAVLLAGPPNMHVAVGLEAMKRGLHVFVEKPAAVTLKDAERLMMAARSKRLVTMVGHNFRHASSIRIVKDLIRQGELAEPTFINVRFLANKPRTTIWGLPSLLWTQLMMMAVHPIDLMQDLMGRATKVNAAVQEQSNGLFVLTTVIHYEQGGTGVLYTGSNCPRFEVNVEISDRSGQLLTIDNLWSIQLRRTPQSLYNKLWSLNWQPSALDSGYMRSGYFHELQQFALAILEGTPAGATLEDYWHTMRLCKAIERSVTENRCVPLQEIQSEATDSLVLQSTL